MSASPWDKALFARAPVIAGVRLRPFSLGHSRALKLLRSPYMTGGDVTTADVLVALNVCRRTVAEIRADLVGRVPASAVMGFALRRYKFAPAHQSLMTYFEDFAAQPEHEEKGGRRYSAPWEYHHVRVLCSVYGYTPDEAWACPVVLARCLYDTDAESQGDDTMISDAMAEGYQLIAEANRLANAGHTKEADALYERAAPLVRKD